jgi:hypothetical protein
MKFPSFNINPTTLLIGAGAVLLAPMALAVASGLFKSATKFGIKTAMISYNKGKEIVSDTTDAVSVITSEAKSEVFGNPKKKPQKAAAAT